MSAVALGQDIGLLVMDFLLLYSSGTSWPSHVNNKAHMNTVRFEKTGVLYEGNSLSEDKKIMFNMTVPVSMHSATS